MSQTKRKTSHPTPTRIDNDTLHARLSVSFFIVWVSAFMEDTPTCNANVERNLLPIFKHNNREKR